MTRPILTREQAVALAPGISDQVFLLGVRGFFDPPAGNKRGVYDDAIFIVTPSGCIGYNANTDPSVNRSGIAVLQDGVYKYSQWLHGVHHLDIVKVPADKVLYDRLLSTRRDLTPIKGRLLPYWAFRQAGPVTVFRDGAKTPETRSDPGSWPYIDIHKGGYNTTSSEGCQTIHPDQWEEMRAKGYDAMNEAGMRFINYVLITKK